MYVIGIGTGRCGTMSLSKLLDGCDGCTVHHELDAPSDVLPWAFDRRLAERKLQRLRSLDGFLVGDVALYYLNYIEFFMEQLPDLKVVHIYRDQQQVVDSYLKKTAGRNHWSSTAGATADVHWDKCYPDYGPAIEKAEAIQRYHEEYLSRAGYLTSKYASRMLHINVDHFNSLPQQSLLFDFLEMPDDRRYFGEVKANTLQSKPHDPAYAQTASQALAELREFVPRDATVILWDQHLFEQPADVGKRVLPFIEREGEFWGYPEDDAAALGELERLRQAGASYVAFPWTSFWCLDYYSGFHQHLRRNSTCEMRNSRLVVYGLSGASQVRQ